MPSQEKEMLRIHVNIEISSSALKTIVANAKRLAPRAPNGSYHIDTADKVSEMVTRFLETHDFDSFVSNLDNYTIANTN